jgi:hypothetical protein
VPEITRRPDGSGQTQKTTGAAEPFAPGKRTLTEQLVVPAPVQRAPAHPASGGAAGAGRSAHEPHIAPPEPGIDKTGFIDNSKGAPIYSAPAEAGSELLRDTPLPPAARVFASGTHPRLKHWGYVTAFAPTISASRAPVLPGGPGTDTPRREARSRTSPMSYRWRSPVPLPGGIPGCREQWISGDRDRGIVRGEDPTGFVRCEPMRSVPRPERACERSA